MLFLSDLSHSTELIKVYVTGVITLILIITINNSLQSELNYPSGIPSTL